ncbi:MAG TPA: cytochrome c biogenesis protein CcsA [Candidatus Hydrogenedentes bacterium]|nr:cytochrome c biogenesis protein CcsA [Candidatus Hydrogenedentota bacterium]HOS01977.1 cytochrome c biogenesis protein CcsA [Candidatus Hydrogenedentota bacterium]
MTALTITAFATGLACCLAGSVSAMAYLRRNALGSLRVARAMAWLGAAALTITFAVRWATWGRVPLATAGDSINVLTLLSLTITLIISRGPLMRGLLAFCLPALTLVYAINAAVFHVFLAQTPKTLHGLPLALHVGLALLAYASFFVASLTSMVYLLQTAWLKRRRVAGLMMRLPSLEQLDKTLYQLIGYGYPAFLATLILGVAWAHRDPELLGPHWWLAPKIVAAFVMAAFYAFCFHGRRNDLLRGRKLALWVFFGFTTLLAAYIAMSLSGVREFHFWRGGE